VTWPAIAEHHDHIVEQAKARVRMSTIHQRLRDERGLAASVASFRRYVNANVPEEVRRARVTAWNPHPAEAGEQAQIDYGQLGRWLDPASGKLRTVQAFVMVLACSRHMFVRPVLKMDQQAWTECHVAAFEFFGGVPARLVPRSPAGCSSSASGICGRSWPSTRWPSSRTPQGEIAEVGTASRV
jgi:transposase